jgi:hypothetical protein
MEAEQGAVDRITGEIFCMCCLNKKFKREGTPISHLKNMMLNLVGNYPNPLTKEEMSSL